MDGNVYSHVIAACFYLFFGLFPYLASIRADVTHSFLTFTHPLEGGDIPVLDQTTLAIFFCFIVLLIMS